MPFVSSRPKIQLTPDELNGLNKISRSRTESLSRIERAQMLLAYFKGATVSTIAREFETNRSKVERTIDRALQVGAITSLDDLPRSGKTPTITAEAKAWLVSIACKKPKDLGYASETWTMDSLAKHVHFHCEASGHPCLSKLGRGTVSKILSQVEIRPHKIEYYVERRDPNFDTKMVQILHVYKEVELLRPNKENNNEQPVAILSYDEKPGIQAIKNTTPDLSPVPGQHPCIARDYEYKRLGTVSFLASIDLLNGQVNAQVQDRHRSREFIEHLKYIDSSYPKHQKIKMILDNHSAHISKETQSYLKTVPNRFEFIFTPTHGSWLNIIETFFSKMSRSFLRGIRVDSIEELKERIEQYIKEINEMPVVFKWKYKLDKISLDPKLSTY